MQLQEIRCTSCGKVLTKAIGEIEIPCRRCGTMVHVVVTSRGIMDLNKPFRKMKELDSETVIK
jgi:phage FluMu protein Com